MEGGYIANLVVNDVTVNSTIATVTITVGPNAAPVVNVGPDQNATVNTLVTLNGSMSSDPEGNVLRYAWGFISQPSGSTAVLNNDTSVAPSFTPDRAGDYVIDLDVFDGALWSPVDTVTITVSNSTPPAGCALGSDIYNFCTGYTTMCSFVTGGNANCDTCRAAGCF